MTDHDYPYIEERDRVLYVRGSRVPLGSLVWLWREGQSDPRRLLYANTRRSLWSHRLLS